MYLSTCNWLIFSCSSSSVHALQNAMMSGDGARSCMCAYLFIFAVGQGSLLLAAHSVYLYLYDTYLKLLQHGAIEFRHQRT